MKLRSIVTVAGIVLCSVASVLIAGFLFEILHASGFWLLPGFGFLGIVVFWQSFPWFPLLAVILLAMALAFLLHHFAACRRHSLLSLSLGLLIFSLLSGFFVSFLPPFRRLHPPPPPRDDRLAESFLRGYGAWRFHNVFQGTAVGAVARSFVLRSPDQRLLPVELAPGVRLPQEPQIGSGDTVLIIGELRDETIRAFGIRKL